ncbi:MAG: hypothetical protein NC833_03085 [Candidatus Omnitrophica bacterium]|nr:hypothetical protein [Candidatus Omnitrophota bacterium]
MNKKQIKLFMYVFKDKYRKRLSKKQLAVLFNFILENADISFNFLLNAIYFSKYRQSFNYYLQKLNQAKEDYLASYRDSTFTYKEPVKIDEIVKNIIKIKEETKGGTNGKNNI